MKIQEEWKQHDRDMLFKLAKDYNLRSPKYREFEWCIWTYSRKYPHDHIFGGFEKGFGLAIRRETQGKYTIAKKKLLNLGFELRQSGDFEGNFYAKDQTLASTIDLQFKFKKHPITNPTGSMKKKTDVA